ncbi:MAG: hypothetical protein QGE95_06745 [Arenicellales bacterium]|nr:hypothetical protein [Pseudomonadales bacterium]MDP7451948.1 hypothetical protein [Arenicellales bacterium]
MDKSISNRSISITIAGSGGNGTMTKSRASPTTDPLWEINAMTMLAPLK